MSKASIPLTSESLRYAVSQLKEATDARKCWTCGCLHESLKAIEKAVSQEDLPPELAQAIQRARERLQPVKYACLGCEVCFPPQAMNALGVETEACPAEEVEMREGWPSLPGAYRALRFNAPVAVCTLGSDDLAESIANVAGPHIAIVGGCQTENLGIERIILNLLANPNIRFLLLCGQDSRQAIGHLPGQSLLALAHSGIDPEHRIVGAKGKRPFLRNLDREFVEHFRRTVEVVDLVGALGMDEIGFAAQRCAERNPGPAQPYPRIRSITTERGSIPEKMVSDPKGYFVVYVDRPRRQLVLEHYRNDGVLDAIVEGGNAAELYMPAIDKGLLSRLDHAAYLGRELARAERSLASGEGYVQDAAPEQSVKKDSASAALPISTCGCSSPCKEPPK